ncbi:MAG: serine hydrolase [Gemmatimonadales bacterium]|nr:serine hydrolase [Gemmatimonadales bacterium]
MEEVAMKALTTAMLAVALLTPVRLCGQETPTPSVSLHLAALRGNTEAIRQHIEAGSDLNEKDPYGSTPLIVAAAFGKTEVARALIEAGADLNITNNDGATALHTAAFLCRTEIVEDLLDNGANKYLRDNFGNTALESVTAPLDDVKRIYDSLGQALGPLGLELDYEQIRMTRPQIAEMLRPRTEELEAVEYTPLPGDDWKVSTPAEQGLDPMLVAELYLNATGLSTLYGLLVIKNGHLIAEGYFNEGAVEQKSARQSVTKSYASALVGVALDQGYLSSVDQKMMDFFPELAGQINDPRKEQITIRDLLQMRAGYPDEERVRQYLDSLFFTDNWHWIPRLVDFPLVSDPGTEFNYSNLTSHLLAVIVARAVSTDLESYGQENLFSRINAQVGDWSRDADGYNFGCFEISFTARDMAKFGLLYLNDGEYEGNRVLPADWVRESLQRYSAGIDRNVGRYFSDIGYGYQWWSASVGEHRFDYAAGHGGNLIVLLDELDMIIVTTADPLYELPAEEGWQFEGAIINLVGKFIKSLPKG